MYSIPTLLSLVGLLSGPILVSAVPVLKEPGDVHLTHLRNYKDADGDVHRLANNDYAQSVADRHPVIISGPPIAHQGGEKYPVIPVTSASSGHPPGEANARVPADDYNKKGTRPFKPNSQLALGEGVHVDNNKLSNYFPPWKLDRSDTDKLLKDNHDANPSLAPERGRPLSRTPPLLASDRSREPSRLPGPSSERDRSGLPPARGSTSSKRAPASDRFREPSRYPGPSRDRDRSASPIRRPTAQESSDRYGEPERERGSSTRYRPSSSRRESSSRGNQPSTDRGRSRSRTPPVAASGRSREPSRYPGTSRNRDRSASPIRGPGRSSARESSGRYREPSYRESGGSSRRSRASSPRQRSSSQYRDSGGSSRRNRASSRRHESSNREQTASSNRYRASSTS